MIANNLRRQIQIYVFYKNKKVYKKLSLILILIDTFAVPAAFATAAASAAAAAAPSSFDSHVSCLPFLCAEINPSSVRQQTHTHTHRGKPESLLEALETGIHQVGVYLSTHPYIEVTPLISMEPKSWVFPVSQFPRSTT